MDASTPTPSLSAAPADAPPAGAPPPESRLAALLAGAGAARIALILLVLAVFAPVRHFGFVLLDDPVYVTANPFLDNGLTLKGLRWAFTTFYAEFWHPVTWLSLLLDHRIYGLNPAGYHVTNLLLHLASTLLLFDLLRRLTAATGKSLVVAALFAIHPLHVESVVWIADRKDVLAGFFFFLTLHAYVGYARRPHLGLWGLAFGLFLLGLMAKPVLVPVPFLLLFLDAWPLGRFSAAGRRAPAKRLLGEKLPFFAAAAAAAVVAWLAQHPDVPAAPGAHPVELSTGASLSTAPVAVVTYLRQMLWPVDLSCFYPAQSPGWRLVTVAGAVLLLASGFAAVMRRRFPAQAVGWFWYLAMLAPVAGAIQIGKHAHADRYTYLPLVGIFILLAWSVPLKPPKFFSAQGRRIFPYLVTGTGVVAVLAAAALAWVQVQVWRNNVTLFSNAVDVNPRNYYAQGGLGTALALEGRHEEALPHFAEAVRLRPQWSGAHNGYALALAATGNDGAAAWEFQEALRLWPENVEARVNYGKFLRRLGNRAAAAAQIRIALDLQPGRPDLLRLLEELKSPAAPAADFPAGRETPGHIAPTIRAL